MSAKTKDERISEKADEIFNLLVTFYHQTTCDSMRCRYDGEWECPRCEAKRLFKWIHEGKSTQ
jgi:hypothetical protein